MVLNDTTLETLCAAALAQAKQAATLGEVPVGAAIAHQGVIIAQAHNLTETRQSPQAHAEQLVIEQASAELKNWRLTECVLCVTLEPCPMCAGAIRNSRIPVVVFGASDQRLGAAGSVINTLEDPRLGPVPRVIRGDVAGEFEKISAQLLKEFFLQRRNA